MIAPAARSRGRDGLARQDDGRLSQILAMAVGGHFDSSMHGWRARARGRAMPCTVAWAPDGTPSVA
jgi:hypothetical protein